MKSIVALVLVAAGVVVCPPLLRAQKNPKSITLREIATYPSKSEEPFTQVGEVTADRDGNVYVTDEFQWSVRKFSADGRMLARFGRRGKALGAFQSGPARVDCLGDTIAIVEMGSNRVQFLTTRFIPIAETYLPGAILDLVLLNDGGLVSATVQSPSRSDRTLGIYSREGAFTLSIPLVKPRHDPILDMTCLARDQNDVLAVAYRFINNVMLFDNHRMLLCSFSVSGLPAESGGEIAAGTFTGMPDELIKDIAFDGRGNIFILSGTLSAHPGRDVFVTDYRGRVQTTVLLPDKSGLIYLDRKGHLFTREQRRTVVKKYRLDYRRF
jgi:hypothetical protein